MSIYETFVTADSDSLGPNHTWSEVTGDWDIVSNAAELITEGGGAKFVRCDKLLNTEDHWAEVTVLQLSLELGPCVRMHPTNNTAYIAQVLDGSNTARIQRVVTGSQTTLGTVGYSPSANDVLRLAISGEDLTLYANGTEILTASDSVLTGYNQVGLNAWQTSTPHGRFGLFRGSDSGASNFVVLGV